jgi:vacuole morphology and inheritance protein 14
MPFVPSLLSHVLPRMSHEVDTVRKAAVKVNASLMDYILSLSDDDRRPDGSAGGQIQLPPSLSELGKELTGTQRQDSNLSGRLLKAVIRDQANKAESPEGKGTRSPTPAEERGPSPRPIPELDYQAAVSALTLQFLNEHEATRVAAIAWLIMLHRIAPGRVRISQFTLLGYQLTLPDSHGGRWHLSCTTQDTVRSFRGSRDTRSALTVSDLPTQ